jgi:hypothetical protein
MLARMYQLLQLIAGARNIAAFGAGRYQVVTSSRKLAAAGLVATSFG